MSDASSPARVALDEPQRSPAEQPSDGLAENGVAEPDPAELSDKDSDLLSEIDEERFDDFEPVEEPSRPVNIDEDAAKTLKASKRKRLGDADGGKTPREGRRQKKRQRDRGDEVMADDDGGETQGRRRVRKPVRSEGEMATQRQRTPEENEEDLTPEERRRRALDRAMDAAIKNPTKRRRKQNEEDLENELDEQIANLKVRMEKACQDDNEARDQGLPAVHKLKLLPEVSAMLNRNTAQSAVLDAESDFFQAVKFFLEPLNDGSLPAYNIQRDIMTALTKLPVDTDLLRSSGIGKIVLFYTRSKRPEPSIKRMAERLIGEWSRPILNRTDDYKKRHIEVRDFDYAAAKLAQRKSAAAAASSQFTLTQRPAGSARDVEERQRQLAPPQANNNRAKPAGLPATYTVAPRSSFDPARIDGYRPIGAGGLEAFRKMTQKGKKK